MPDIHLILNSIFYLCIGIAIGLLIAKKGKTK